MKLAIIFNLFCYWLGIVPGWDKCTRASCWDGRDAERRMMNILSPYFSDEKFEEYVKWMEDRGCNTAHVFLANEGDGEGSGYYATDATKLSQKRIKYLRVHGFAVVAWLMADDSPSYASAMFAHPREYVQDLKDKGLLEHVSFIVLGLEMNEKSFRDGATHWPIVAQVVRELLPRMKIGVHHTSGHLDYAELGDIVCDQLSPGVATPARIRESVNRIRSMGKQAIGFEYDRHPNRERAEAALQAGAFSVGNW